MNRKRPKQYSNSSAPHPKLRKRWRSWLPMMSTDLAHLLGRREIFWELQEIAKENSRILEHGAFFDWMCTNYVVTASIGIRSFTDQSKGVRSLWRMLFEMLEHPGVLSRSAHVALYKKAAISPHFDLANISFNNIAGKGRTSVSQQAIRTDLRALEDSSERVRRFVNKRIAHRTPQNELRRLPKFHELDQAMDTIDRIFCKYNLILTAKYMETAHATRQDNWKVVLYEAWIKPGSKFLPDYY